jgi:tRNA nucleotidyltransferase/poly(A) polymerase
MRQPRAADLPPAEARAAQAIAAELGRHGWRAWVVGGAVRDLALGRVPEDVDLACAARPEDVAALFRKTRSVGKAFGTTLVLDYGVEVEVTTFRAESGYSDGRRPDRVRFGATLEEDAARRDFTCNALYLDPATDEVADPTGGLADLERGVLAPVGDPRERFAEDGLRLLRLARLSAELGLRVEPATLAAARASVAALRGVSAERIYVELAAMARGAAPAAAFDLLAETGVLEHVLGDPAPAQKALWRRLPELPAEAAERAAQAELAWLAALVDGASEALARLRAPKAVFGGVGEILSLARALEAAPPAGRAAAIRLVRHPRWHALWAIASARGGALRLAAAELAAMRATLGPDELFPEPLLTSADLAAAGIPPGPRFGALLAALEEAQLDRRLCTRAEALAWLARALESQR